MVLKKKRKGGAKTGGQRQPQSNSKRHIARSDEATEIKALEVRIRAEAPKSGRGVFTPSNQEKESVEGGPALTTQLFKELPISQRTLKALKQSNFVKMTEIQRGAIPHALAGRDILGEARTGSGKTLAFLVPLIELLFRQRWTRMDGLGGLIVSPTRELSHQIFQVLAAVGAEQDLSAGCIVGGRDLSEEQMSVITMNILVATPGRLLQHLDETPGFDASNLQMLAIDEADRILDFGFQETMSHILQHITPERQTMLFSATLHTSVHRLSKMALRSPEIVSVHKDAKSRTPDKLKQVYMTVPLEQKIDILFSFLRSHSQKKMIVFVSSCKQVRFFYECFRQLKPGPAVMEFHGKQSLVKRLAVFQQFTERERAVALFCTDIAARGVDFPTVDWVVQLDCPDSVDSYVHRVGRTARYESGGNSALFLLPSEEAFIQKLKAGRIDVKSISAKQGKVQTIQAKIQGVIAGDQSIKHLAQKSMISYVRSIKLMKDKDVFNVQSLPLETFANSLGLAYVPEGLDQVVGSADDEKNPAKMKKNQTALQRLRDKIKAKKKEKAASAQGTEATPAVDEDSESNDLQRPDKGKKKKLSRLERRSARIERTKAAPPKPVPEDDDLLVPVSGTADATPEAPVAKKRKMRLGKDGIAVGAAGTHTFFGNKGTEAASEFAQIAADSAKAELGKVDISKESRQAFLNRVSADLADRDGDDAAVSRARIQDKHKKRKRIAKDGRRGEEGGEEIDTGVELGGASSRSASPCASDGERSDSPATFQGAKNAFAGGRPAPEVPAFVPKRSKSTNFVPKRPDSRLQEQPSAGGERDDMGDDLGDLEKQVLSKLSGLF